MRSAVATVLRAPHDFARRYRMSCFAKLRSERPSWLGKDSACFIGSQYPINNPAEFSFAKSQGYEGRGIVAVPRD